MMYPSSKTVLFSKQALLGTIFGPLLLCGFVSSAVATEPCDDFGKCKAVIEINASDGDIGFHWLVDADDLNSIRIKDPNGAKVFENKAFGPLGKQKLTETFGESSEPVCRSELAEDEDEVVVRLEDFLTRWASGTYEVSGSSDGGEKLSGETQLSHYLPAAPENVQYLAGTSTISWSAGVTLGECATEEELDAMVVGLDPMLPIHPKDVPLVAWEIVFAVEEHPELNFAVRVPPTQYSVTLPTEFAPLLGGLPANTPAKIEVGAIGGNLDPTGDGIPDPEHEKYDDDNATFTEQAVCLNGAGCPAD